MTKNLYQRTIQVINDAQLRNSSGRGSSVKSTKVSERSDDRQVPGRKHLVDTDDVQVSGILKLVGQNHITDPADCSKQIQKESTRNDGQVPGIVGKHHEMYSVKGSKEVNVRISSDKKICLIHDFCLLSDGRLLMSDFNNDKIKVLDSNLVVSDQ